MKHIVAESNAIITVDWRKQKITIRGSNEDVIKAEALIQTTMRNFARDRGTASSSSSADAAVLENAKCALVRSRLMKRHISCNVVAAFSTWIVLVTTLQ